MAWTALLQIVLIVLIVLIVGTYPKLPLTMRRHLLGIGSLLAIGLAGVSGYAAGDDKPAIERLGQASSLVTLTGTLFASMFFAYTVETDWRAKDQTQHGQPVGASAFNG